MSLSVKVILFLFCATVLHGVKLPGQCPQAPATHKFRNVLSYYPELILGVPFTDPKTTLLFKDVRTSNVQSYYIQISRNYTRINFEVRDPYPYETYYSESVLEYANTSESDSLYLRSHISVRYKNDSTRNYNCNFISEVNVRIWFDGEFVIIWSCRDNNYIDHEEAVLMVAYHDSYNISYHGQVTEYSKMMKRLKNVAQKYLKEDLLNKIQWTQEPDFGQSTEHIEKVVCTNDTIEIKATMLSMPMMSLNPLIKLTNLEVAIISVSAFAIIVFMGIMIWNATRQN